MENELNNPMLSGFLFEENDIYAAHEILATDKLPLSGSNKKGIVIAYGPDDTLSSDDQQQLLRILAALKLSEQDVAFIPAQALYENGWATLSGFEFDKFLGFGVSAIKMGLQLRLKKYVTTSFRDKKMLFSDGLSQLAQDPKLKALLWSELQAMFEIKK
ncbi:MAG: hypothetical protein SFW35_02655 [Chitinophagales bacterium]|nr:hypothetical protein [Chitinophagales bacterium]